MMKKRIKIEDIAKRSPQLSELHKEDFKPLPPPFDKPESANTLIYLIHHASRKQADANWQAFLDDPQWQKVARESQVDGKILAARPERIYLRALDFSPLR